MIGLKTSQEVEYNIPTFVWPVRCARIVNDRKWTFWPSGQLNRDTQAPYLREITIMALLPWWAWLTGGIIHKKCKSDIENMCVFHGHRDAKYKIIVK